jgi:hypothetical protein
MNREEAKYVLSAYPVTGDHCDDSQFKEALLLAQQDPELREWFSRERAFDMAIARKLEAICPPPDLQAQLLAARKIIPMPGWRQQFAWLAAAAAVIIVAFTLSYLRWMPRPTLALEDFKTYVADTATTLDHLDLNTSNLSEIRDWLKKSQAPSGFTVPSGFAQTQRVGCRVFDWHGRRVSLVCFALSDQKVAHMFIIERSVLQNVPANAPVRVHDVREGIATAVWTDNANTYVVALRDGGDELRRVFL